MSRVKKFNDFLNEKYPVGLFINEKYEESPDFRIKSFFEELEKNIRNWFVEGTLAANGAELGKIERSLANAIDKNLIFEFSDEEFFYQVYVILSLQEVGEDELDECFVKVKKYDIETMTLLRSLGEDVKVSDLNEDKILELFSKMDEESGSVEMEEGEVTVSDEDSDLEDTNLV
jgi:hypothetical protein